MEQATPAPHIERDLGVEYAHENLGWPGFRRVDAFDHPYACLTGNAVLDTALSLLAEW